MTEVPIPDTYRSIEDLAAWLSIKMPHDEHWGDVLRWQICSGQEGWFIRFKNPADVTLFNLMWSR